MKLPARGRRVDLAPLTEQDVPSADRYPVTDSSCE